MMVIRDEGNFGCGDAKSPCDQRFSNVLYTGITTYISRSVYLIDILPADNAIQCVFSRAVVTDKWLRTVCTSMSEVACALPVTWRRAATNYAVGNIHSGEKDTQTSWKLLLLLLLYYRLSEF